MNGVTNFLKSTYDKHSFRLIECQAGVTPYFIRFQRLLETVSFNRVRDLIEVIDINLDIICKSSHCNEALVVG